MLYLRPDAELRRVKGIPFYTIGSHAHTAEIVLWELDRRAGKGKVPGLKAGLRKGDIATHSLCLTLGEIQRNHVKDRLRHLRIFRFDISPHLLRCCPGIPHNLCVSVRAGKCTAHRCLDRFTETVHGVPHSKLCPQMLRVAVVGSDAPAVSLPVTDDDSVLQRV